MEVSTLPDQLYDNYLSNCMDAKADVEVTIGLTYNTTYVFKGKITSYSNLGFTFRENKNNKVVWIPFQAVIFIK